MSIYIQNERNRALTKIVLHFFSIMAILANISAMQKELNRMLPIERGDPLPLQSFLNRYVTFFNIIDRFWSIFITSKGYILIFDGYLMGGFTVALIIYAIIGYIADEQTPELTEREKFGRMLFLIYASIFLLSIIYGYNREKWIPYVQQPAWEINMVSKQQLSAGTYLMIFLYIYFLGGRPSHKRHRDALKFYNNHKFITYVFMVFMLDNLGSFDWFVNGWGYEEIFRYGQTLFTFDKVYHFSSSSALTIVLLMFIKNRRKVVTIAISLVISWEIFEISLNPLESSDSGLDMLINSTAIILTAILLERFEYKFNK